MNKKGSVVIDQGSIKKQCELFGKLERVGQSSKTFQPLSKGASLKFCKTLPKWGGVRNGIVFPLPSPAGGINGKESGLLPTIRASEWKGCGPMGSKSHTQWKARSYLSGVVTDSGKLSPMFAECLMGFPEGWTDLNSSGTPSCRKSRKSSGE